jgi:hypothetical protein
MMEDTSKSGLAAINMGTSPRAGTPASNSPWELLEEGNDVVLENGNHRFAGKVDALSVDRNIIWVTSCIGERRLFHVADGYEVVL